MQDEEGIRVQFVYILDESMIGTLVSENAYFCTVSFSKNGILHQEIFDLEDVVYLKEIIIPIVEEEGDQE